MIVKTKENQISFLYQETDPYFDIGYKILEKSEIAEMLPCRRKMQNDKNKLCFYVEGKESVLLQQVLPKLDHNAVVDILYELMFLTQKVEANGFLKKECIWYKYEHIYYNTAARHILTAILPITREFRYADGLDWFGRFAETIAKVSAYLGKEQAAQMEHFIHLLQHDKISYDEVLEEIERFGSGMSGILAGKSPKEPDICLQLYCSGREGELTFQIDRSSYTIGANSEACAGVIPENISRAVSRRHCMIVERNKKYFVQDLGSTNHTFVNAQVIPKNELMELSNHDILSVADVEFRVKIEQDRQ